MDNAEDFDDTLLANIADSTTTNTANDEEAPASSTAPGDTTPPSEHDDMTDSAAHALAAISLDQLLNW